MVDLKAELEEEFEYQLGNQLLIHGLKKVV
jgi:hypothetical protein